MVKNSQSKSEIKPVYFVYFFGFLCCIALLYQANFLHVYEDEQPVFVDNQSEIATELTELTGNQMYFGSLHFQNDVHPRCAEIRVSGSHLPAGLLFSKYGSFHGTPVQYGFYRFFYRCSIHGVDSFGSFPIFVDRPSDH